MVDLKRSVQQPKDTSPLNPEQLSDEELRIILEIERRLKEAKDTAPEREPHSLGLYLATVQQRHPRVLLLDGGRGTGKTSLLLTLVERWHLRINDDPEYSERRTATERGYQERMKTLLGHSGDSIIPDHIKVLDILDFDPLPLGMPLIAGIIQAWQSLAEEYDRMLELSDANYDQIDTRLTDLWHNLFRVAAVGWDTLPQNKGLIEHVLDRQDQVQDWRRLGRDWQSFVNKVFERGKKLENAHRLSKESVFVIMIDDVDLQVRRIHELLHALRLLYHPKIYFLVAADRRHMNDMLRLHFYGEQNVLAHHQNAITDPAVKLASSDRWTSVLAHSSIEKVFPKRNRWKLDKLSVFEFLGFPGKPADVLKPTREQTDVNFLTLLDSFEKRTTHSVSLDGTSVPPDTAGNQILAFARRAEGFELPGVMPYRAAEQLAHYAMCVGDTDGGQERAAEVLARLLSGNGDDYQAVVQRSKLTDDVTESSGLSPAPDQPRRHFSIAVDVQITGELAALYRPGPTIPGGTFNVVVSARPDFVFIDSADNSPTRMSADPVQHFNFTGALIAKMLHEAEFPVDATALRWETYLSHAWTEWFLSPRLSFAWNRRTHPRPDQLLEQSRTWAEFITRLGEAKDPDKLERYAYAWVYYQRKWSDTGPSATTIEPTKLEGASDPLKDSKALRWGAQWDELLGFTDSDEDERKKWQNEILPLLARPEIGFPPKVQEVLLRGRENRIVVTEELKRLRRRWVTDAVVAAAMQHSEVTDASGIPSESDIDVLILKIDTIYEGSYSDLGSNHWKEIEVSGSGAGEAIQDQRES